MTILSLKRRFLFTTYSCFEDVARHVRQMHLIRENETVMLVALQKILGGGGGGGMEVLLLNWCCIQGCCHGGAVAKCTPTDLGASQANSSKYYYKPWETELNTKFNDKAQKQIFQHFSFKSISRGLWEHSLRVSQRLYFTPVRLAHLMKQIVNFWRGSDELQKFVYMCCCCPVKTNFGNQYLQGLLKYPENK